MCIRDRLPVQDGSHVAPVIKDGVVEAVVAVDDPEAHLVWDPLAELGGDPFDQPLVVVAVHEPVAELLPPPFELALDVAVPAGQVAQSDVCLLYTSRCV